MSSIPSLYAKIPYDPFKDFAPIAELGTSPNVIVIDPKLGIHSIAELFARAKAKPDELNYASPGAGTTPHLSGELLKIVGRRRDHPCAVLRRGSRDPGAARRHHANGGRRVAAGLPYIESGAIKALAVTGERRWLDLPDVPTMIELGYKDFIAETVQFFLAPAKTPPDIVAKLAAKSIEVLKKPEVIKQLRDNGYEVVANGSEGLRKHIETEVPKWRDVIAKAGIKPV